MSQEIVGIKIQVNGQEKVLSTMGDLRKEIKQAQFDVLKFSQEFGETSKQALDAAKRVAELKDTIADASEKVGLFDPGKKFQVVGNAVNALAGGFAAVQGALGLVGVESESVEKSLLKVQSALALSQGLSTIVDSAKDFKRLGAVASSAFDSIKTGAANAFKSIKAGLASTGIGLLVIALGAIVAYWDDIKELVGGVSSEQENLNKLAKENLTTQEEKLDAIDGQSNQLRLQGKSEKDILNLKIKQTDEAIKAAEINIANAKATKDAQIQATQRNREILLGIINFISTPVKYLLGAVDSIGKALGKDFALVASQEKANQMMANYVFDPAETAKEGDKTIKEAEATLNKLKEKRATSIIALQNLDKQGAKKSSGDAERIAKEKEAAEKEASERLNQLKADTAVAGIENEYEAKKKAIQNQLEKEIRDVNNNEKLKAETKAALVLALTNKSNLEIAAVNKDAAEKAKAEKEKKDKEDKDALLKQQEDDRKIREIGLQDKIDLLDRENAQNELDFEQDLQRLADKKQILREQELLELENTELTEAQKTEIQKKYADLRKDVTTQELAVETAAQQAKIDLNNRYLDLAGQFGSVLQQIAGKNKALAIAGVVVEQAASIGRIISNTAVANAKAAAASPLTLGQPFVAINSISAGLSIASSVAAGLKAVQQINSAQPGGGGGASPVSGGGAAAPIAPAAPIQNTVTQLDQQSVNAMGSATNRAYVVESDVTNKQERITRINRAARLS
jgi:hypothetical protein